MMQGNSPKCPQGLFLFGKILLLNPAAPSIQGRACPLTQPTSPARPGLSGSGPHTVQLSTLPSWRPWSQWVYHFILIPIPVTSNNQVSLGAIQALFGRGEPLAQLFPRSPTAGPAGQRAWGSSRPGPCTGPRGLFCSEAIPLLSVFSVSSILFVLLSS